MTVAEDGQTPCQTPPGSARECGLEPPRCRRSHRLAIVTVAFAQHADGQKSKSTDLHNDVAQMSRAPPGCRAYSSTILMTDVLGPGRDEMVPVDLSLTELAPVQPIEAPVSFAYEKWVAAGKPCLRQSCGHHHADHIPSEAMECNQCDCLRFVGFADHDDCRCRSYDLPIAHSTVMSRLHLAVRAVWLSLQTQHTLSW
jgi:hypothetical protein